MHKKIRYWERKRREKIESGEQSARSLALMPKIESNETKLKTKIQSFINMFSGIRTCHAKILYVVVVVGWFWCKNCKLYEQYI